MTAIKVLEDKIAECDNMINWHNLEAGKYLGVLHEQGKQLHELNANKFKELKEDCARAIEKLNL